MQVGISFFQYLNTLMDISFLSLNVCQCQVGMRDFSSQEIEEELFDKEMELEEKELQNFTIDEQQIA